MQEASNPVRVKVFGPAVERPVKTFQPTYLIVDCSEAGPGDVLVAVYLTIDTRQQSDDDIYFYLKTDLQHRHCHFFSSFLISFVNYVLDCERMNAVKNADWWRSDI